MSSTKRELEGLDLELTHERSWARELTTEQLQERGTEARLLAQAVRDAFLLGEDQSLRLHLVVLRQLLDGGEVVGTGGR